MPRYQMMSPRTLTFTAFADPTLLDHLHAAYTEAEQQFMFKEAAVHLQLMELGTGEASPPARVLSNRISVGLLACAMLLPHVHYVRYSSVQKSQGCEVLI
ncbi:hypothetical protein Mapa_009636 [Marchantia paleacea]|nr:hypothetical protein Mapa_009636 [Marchantia paleacea]